jgi:hypothetical protein
MRARDLLTALTITTQKEYQGIYLKQETSLIPFTTITKDSSENLLLFSEPNQPALPIKELYTYLMLNKHSPLIYWNGESWQPVYGFREENQQIIL